MTTTTTSTTNNNKSRTKEEATIAEASRINSHACAHARAQLRLTQTRPHSKSLHNYTDPNEIRQSDKQNKKKTNHFDLDTGDIGGGRENTKRDTETQRNREREREREKCKQKQRQIRWDKKWFGIHCWQRNFLRGEMGS